MSVAEVVRSAKDVILEAIFDQFTLDSDDYPSFKFNIEYLVNITSNHKLGYHKIF